MRNSSNGSVFDIIHPASLVMTPLAVVFASRLSGLAGVKIYSGIITRAVMDFDRVSWRAIARLL